MRRTLAAALIALGLCSCHEDASVQQVFVPPIPSALGITASGGNAGATAAVAGTGGQGGDLICAAVSSLSIGTLTTQPSPPPTPSAPVPTTSDIPVINGTDDWPLPGNMFINTPITTAAGDGTITFTSTNGDIVVSSTITAFDPGAGAPVDLEFFAPNGTVWITGTVRTSNTDVVLDGDSAGGVFIQAARVVITGTIDAQGQASSTAAGGTGGLINVFSVGSYVLLGSGTILASGGNGVTAGGDGDIVNFYSDQKLNLYGTITANGGAVTGGTGPAVAGGDGAELRVDSPIAIDIVGTVSLRGGSAITTGDGATGGAGGDLPVIFSAGIPLRLYGALDVSGGSATAADVGGGITGGAAGRVRLGDGAPLLSLETGVGIYGFNGGTGELQGGAGGIMDFDAAGGQLLLGGTLQAQGGLSNGGGGGNGGPFTADVAGPGILTSTATINVSSGSSAGGAAPVAGLITFTTFNGDLTVSGSIVASAGPSSGPLPDFGGNITGTSSGARISWSASTTSVGGASTAAGALGGGDGGNFFLQAPHATGAISLTGAVNLDGGASTGAGVAGMGGQLTINTSDDFISIGASVFARGGAALGSGTGGQGGRVVVLSDADGDGIGGDITLLAGVTIDVSGGSGTIGGSAKRAVPGDAVVIEADGNDSNNLFNNGRVNLAGSVLARGGATGGDGGNVLVDGRNAAGTAVPPAVTTVSVTGNGAGLPGTVFTPP